MNELAKQAIRNARLAERTRRNNPWCEPPVTEPRATDEEIVHTVHVSILHKYLIGSNSHD
ncbi:MAG: hypothetical protein V3V96_15465 [Acidiferrobacterales bacterium]